MFITGLERVLVERPGWLREPFGLLANVASVTKGGQYAWEALADAGADLRCVFSPQHGLWAEEQANMIESSHGRLRRPGVPVYSLYGASRTPTDAMLTGIRRLVVDLQDVGTRVYTFAWTMHHCLQACARHGIGVTVLDRPNPLGSEIIEGPRLDPGVASFVGEAPIPMRHGLTLGELAKWLVRRNRLDVELETVSVENWDRATVLAATWPVSRWIPPSPNLPTPHSTLLYPGMVLLEGTNLSEGRGTTRPFEVAGAPFIDGEQLAAALATHHLQGICWMPIRFRPTFDKWRDEICGGVWLRVDDPCQFRPYLAAVTLLAEVRRLWPHDFAWRPPPYEYESGRWPIDIISGSSALREWLSQEGDRSRSDIESLASVDVAAWKSECR